MIEIVILFNTVLLIKIYKINKYSSVEINLNQDQGPRQELSRIDLDGFSVSGA